MSPRIVLRSSSTFRCTLPTPYLALYTPSSFPTARHSSTSSISYRDSLVKSTAIPAPHTGDIRILSLNNPATRNAISVNLLYALAEHVKSIGKENGLGPTRALIIASEIDSAFCAGADLKERRHFTQQQTSQFLSSLRGTLTMLSSLQIPTISAISSIALGGGFELALATNLRVLASTAVVGLPETRLAIIPGAGGTYRLPALIGRSHALDLMLTGRRVDAAEAKALGIADRVVNIASEADFIKDAHRQADNLEPEEAKKRASEARMKLARYSVLTEAKVLAEQICEGGPRALRGVLRSVQSGEGEVGENREYEGVVETRDRNEALRAFGEKRKPAFKGE